MGVQGSSQAIVQVVWGVNLPRPEVDSLGHATGGHNADELVEIGVLTSHCFIQRCCQSLHT